jgi:hypothetical protein
VDTTGWDEQEYLAAVQAGIASPRPAPLGVFQEGDSKKVRRWFGLDIHVENPAGSIRQWPGGSTNMLYDYGEITNTDGADGEPVDVYVGPHPASAREVHVVHQLKAPDFLVYDEAKCFVGFKSAGDAKKAYEAHYTNPAFWGGMESFPVGDFVQYVKDHGTSPGKPPVTFWDLWNSTKGLL